MLMDEPASALDPISTTAIEDLMHELKREYTIVIVTHNMQQAARVADMTAFFSVEVRRGAGPAHGHPRRVRPDADDLHQALRQADGGLRHGEIRMRITLQEELDQLEASLQEEGAARPPLAPRRAQRAPASGRRAGRRGDRLRRRGGRELLRDRRRASSAPRAADPGGGRPPARARHPPRQPPPRAHGRLLRHDRQARRSSSRRRSQDRRSSRASRRWDSAPRR